MLVQFSLLVLCLVSVGRLVVWFVGWLAAWCICAIFGVLNRFTCNWTQTTYQTTHQHSSQYHQNENVHNHLLSMKANDKSVILLLLLLLLLVFERHFSVPLDCIFANKENKERVALYRIVTIHSMTTENFSPKKSDSHFQVNQFQAYRNRGNHMHFRYVCDSNAGKWKSWNKKNNNKQTQPIHTYTYFPWY